MGRLSRGLRSLAKEAIKGYLRLTKRAKPMARGQRPPTPWKGSIGQETDWIPLCQLEIVSGKLQVHDASSPPTEGLPSPDVYESFGQVLVSGKPVDMRPAPDPIVDLPPGQFVVTDRALAAVLAAGGQEAIVDLPPGQYAVTTRCMQWGQDRRVSRLRVILKGRRGQRGERVGQVGIDTAQCGVCDPEAFSAAWRQYRGDAGDAEEECYVSGEERYRAVALDEQDRAVMALVRSGFGDGCYPVYELVSRSSRVGVEVVFVQEDEPYPF